MGCVRTVNSVEDIVHALYRCPTQEKFGEEESQCGIKALLVLDKVIAL